MSVAFRNVAVTLEDTTLHVSGDLTNQSAEPWLPEDGWAAGYHLFDDPTGTLVVDGERIPLHLEPRASRHLEMQIATPPEPGEYSVYVSPVREHVAWFYEQGWPFLLIDVTVREDGAAILRRWRIADMRSVRVKRLARGAGRAFSLPFVSIWRNRGLIRTLVRRDVLSRYTGSFGGAFWTVLNPLIMMLTYFFVFGIVMNQKFKGDPSRTSFALYFLAGMLPWLAFNEAIARAPFIMIEHRNFIKKLVFPVETLPVNVVVAGLVTEFFGMILFALALLLIRGHVPLTILWLPLVIVPQILFTAGISWFLAALGVFVRDLGQVIGYLLTVLMFITPIFYSEDALPPVAAGFQKLNPIFTLVHSYRAVLLEAAPPDWRSLGWLALVAVTVFIVGHAWFYKLRKSFADLI
ncbi:MAG TPA: ABC transporter permease [Bryobacteraceae bacterium]|nr:ABC transporter permease [Bryobacteraceae bacterium]